MLTPKLSIIVTELTRRIDPTASSSGIVNQLFASM